jgi:hypothetical protein
MRGLYHGALFTILGLGGVPAAEAAGFTEGEGMTFELQVGPIAAGRARLSVGAAVGPRGRRLAAAHGDAHSAEWLRAIVKLDDDYQVVFDAERLLPRRTTTVETGLRTRTTTLKLEAERLEVDFQSPEEKWHDRRALTAPGGPARDPLTALFLLRAAALHDGDAIDFTVLDGAALYAARAKVERRETLARDEGPGAAIRIAIEARPIDDAGRADRTMPVRRIVMWLSDDARRLPYRIEGDSDIGKARVELTSYLPPVEAAPIEAPAGRPPPAASSLDAILGAGPRLVVQP